MVTIKPELYANCIIYYLAFALLIMPLRLLGVFNTVYIVLPISLAVSLAIGVHYFFITGRKSISLGEFFIGFFPILLIPLGLVNEHPLNYIITDTLKPILWVAIICYFKNTHINNTQFMVAIHKPLILLSFCAFTTVVFVNYIVQTSGGVRLSASDIAMLFPLLYFFVQQRHFPVLLIFLLLVLGGKVGPLLSILVVWGVFYLLRFSVSAVFYSSVICCLIFWLIVNFSYDIWSGFLPILTKFRIFFTEEFTLADLDILDKYLLGGRLSEIFGSMSIYKEDLVLLFSGPGVGYTYDLYRDGVLEQSNRHGVHMSPVSLLTIYGAFYTVIFYGYMSYIIFKCLRVMKENRSKFQVMAAMFVIGNLVNSFTVYSIWSVLLFPMSIGLVLNKFNEQGDVK